MFQEIEQTLHKPTRRQARKVTGIAGREYSRRRRELMRLMGPAGIAVLPAAPVRIRNGDVEHAYRQDSDFYYLSGFCEPDAVLVLAPGRVGGEFILFCRERDPQREIWEGCMAGLEGAISAYGADDAFPISDLEDILPNLLDGRAQLHYTMGRNPLFDHQFTAWVERARVDARKLAAPSPGELVPLDPLLHEMRLFKSSAEIKLLQRAADCAVHAHERALRRCHPGMAEYQLEAELCYQFRLANACASYLPIVGSGPNACVLHYIRNDRVMRDGDMVLVDAGAEVGGYASDVTRSYPVNGRFAPPQRELYELVLAAQNAALEKVAPGAHWLDPHHAAVRTLCQGLLDLKILQGDLEANIEQKTYQQYYMHKTGHWLGLDVHDVGDYQIDGHWRLLEPGMVLTVEPGLYIAADAEVPERFRGIGIRIEDDVVVTAEGYHVLSEALVRAPAEIEQQMQPCTTT